MTPASMMEGSTDLLLPALEQAAVAVVVIDDADRVLFFNQAAERLWGFNREEVLGRHMRPLLPRELRGVHDGFTRKNREGGSPRVAWTSRELLMERKDGQRLWAAFSLSKIDVGGRIHYMAFARDVSAEVERREENRLLLLAVNHTDRPIFVLDGACRIVQANRAFTELFGYTATEIIGMRPDDVLAGPGAPPAALARVWERARPGFSEEIRAMCRDGRELWVRASVDPVFDGEADTLRNQVVVLSDVTEERQIRDLERDVLEALTSDLPFPALGDFLCRRIEAIVPGVLVSVCRVVERRLRPWAAPSFHASYGAEWEGVEIGEGVAGCGTCAHRGEPVMVHDIGTDPLWAPYRDRMLAHGYRACWTYPVKRRDGSVAGTFAFYFRRGGGPDAYLERVAAACVRLCTLAIEHEESRQQLNRLSRYDALTGLPNRAQLLDHVGALLASRGDGEVAFFHIGLDRFKDVNETLGHAAGDQTLAEMANRLKWHLSEDQFLARVEGDAFVLVVPGCDAHRAVRVAADVQQAISAPIDVAGFSLDLSASIGIVHYPGASRDRDELLQNARSAMERVKAAGGGDALFFSHGMNRLARDRLLLGAALRRAVAAGDLRLEYQPQVRPGCGGLYGVEALARWCDPEFGEVPPDRFIGLAEEIGEIEAIGRWALREACRAMARWRAAGLGVPVVAINLSPFNFRSRDLPDCIAALLDEHDLPGRCLTVEITEGLMMEATPQTLDIMRRIRALGVGLSVDDFGTGFSSLSSLASLPVTEVKMDRSFIARCEREKRAQTLVTAMIGVGRSLDLTVVAEGVESEDQRRLLHELECPVVQGYLFSRPLPLDAFERWLAARGGAAAPAVAGGAAVG
ncbi:oxygen-sensing cyclic-di-GMP phosphodiesterase DosP [Coralloluteibacterium thermophilus]|uniref:Oxygen-sensing cyclic-di-GMP phosphodiesterase DosP n=1 Tax=Coralloluteibacterium thermophilum TaxID=2707049 RepID=A0ABV9NGT5_9GAMM